jgi:hypothetical protein
MDDLRKTSKNSSNIREIREETSGAAIVLLCGQLLSRHASCCDESYGNNFQFKELRFLHCTVASLFVALISYQDGTNMNKHHCYAGLKEPLLLIMRPCSSTRVAGTQDHVIKVSCRPERKL